MELGRRWSLSPRRPIEAPFAKLNILMYNEDSDRPKPLPFNVDGIAEVWVPAAGPALLGEYTTFRSHLHEILMRGVAETTKAFDWDATPLTEILEDIAGRKRVFHYRIERFSKTDRKTARRVELYHEMTEDVTLLRAEILDKDGDLLREVVVAQDNHPLPLDLFFPVKSVVLRDGCMIFRDRWKAQLAVLPLT